VFDSRHAKARGRWSVPDSFPDKHIAEAYVNPMVKTVPCAPDLQRPDTLLLTFPKMLTKVFFSLLLQVNLSADPFTFTAPELFQIQNFCWDVLGE
jgi:hypothetical protein